MRYFTLIPMLLAAGVANAQAGQGGGRGGQNGQNGQNNNNAAGGGGGGAAAGANALALNPANVQKASQSDGFTGTQEAGQAKSVTDAANFINFCTGKTLTNGLQTKGGSCNGIVMGDIPSTANMVSAIFTSPTNNQQIATGKSITFSVKIAGLVAGTFTNPDNTYYAAPQALQGGKIVGHTHVSVQSLNNQANPTNALDANTFAFFKGINDAGDGQGTLSATLAAGLPVGLYRVCSITAAANHQPVVMPIAQRGPQDDCVRFQVTAAGGGGNNAGGNAGGAAAQNGGQQGQQAAQQGQQAAQQGQQAAQQGQQAAQQGGQQGAQKGKGAFGGKGRGRGRKFAARDFIA